MEVTRIFDLLPYIKENYEWQDDQLAGKINGEWKTYSIDDYIEYANNVSYALLALGIQKDDKIAIISSNRPEWNFLDIGIQQIGAIPVPIYPTISESDYEYILNLSEVKIIFSEGAELLAKLQPILDKIPTLQELFTFIDRGKGHRFFAQLIELGKQNPQPELLEKLKANIKPEDLATIIFTSGTTGNQKGVMLKHSSIVQNFKCCEPIPHSPPGSHALSFLPLCHVYERMICYLWHYKGYAIYYAENIGTIAADAKYVRPEVMTCVPRILEKLYDKIYVAGESMPFFKRTIYYWALDLAMKYKLHHRSWYYNFKHRIADKLVYHKLRDILGGRLEIIISGGAALQERLACFFTGVGFPILEGYGLTETSPVIAVSNFSKHGRKFGTVGPPLEGLDVKIASDGEILCKGHNVMIGYYKNPEETAAVIDKNGYFHTGDLGQIEKHGQLRITGRKKALFKTSFGKYVNPNLVEEKFKESPFIDQLMVTGDGQKFPAAVITLDWTFMPGWWARHKMGVYPKDRQDIVNNPIVKKRILKEVAKYNKFFGDYEQIKKITIIADEWTPQTRELTPTLKLRRNLIEERYKEIIAELFV
ncbi:MAG: long-chain fatty acid--CoA ligase [Bacteroidales bacterium]|jgi:long-chain acyl-CoA synthetase|nr:long-chain fatty acid--CoA ligase [Bacteroidales bacterium]